MIAMPENIVLWRHAQANDIFDDDSTTKNDSVQSDLQRALTEKGQCQAADMAKWLKPKLPKDTLLQCSPALRAIQTAEALSDKININQVLKPGASMRDVLAYIIHAKAADSLLIVGHQPWLGQLAAHLIGFSDSELAIKKGAIWWLQLNKNGLVYKNSLAQYNIHTVQTPSLL